jgi:molecular chaperone GrpE
MSKHKDEKHHHRPEPGAGHGPGHDEHHSGQDGHRSSDPAERPIELNPNDAVAAGAEAELLEQISLKDKEIAELKDKYLRGLAEADNVRKRMRQQSEESVRLQRESLLRDLLPITDNLERAVDAARGGGNGKPIVEGVEMVLRSLLDFLRNQGVAPRESIGQPFDPQFHEAVDHVESTDYPPNTVINEFHRGYQVGERMLRPARVSVAKAPSRGEPPPNSRENKGDNGANE